jgi:hypothetical protein
VIFEHNYLLKIPNFITSMRKRHSILLAAFFGAICIAAISTASAQSVLYSNIIYAKADIFAANQTTPPAFDGGGGYIPEKISLNGATNLNFSASGTTMFDYQSNVSLGPDGGQFEGPTNINSAFNISGIKGPDTGFLIGLFLGSNGAVGPAPASLDFSQPGGTSFLSLSPLLGQTFFIGDGLTGTGTGSIQDFLVPKGASYLYLGFADGYEVKGDPGYYGDNKGTLDVTVVAVPEPTPIALFALGCIGLIGIQALRSRHRVRIEQRA